MGRRLLTLYAGMAHGARAALELLDDELAASTSCKDWHGGEPTEHEQIAKDIADHIGRAIGEVDAIARRLYDLADLFAEGS